jgi:hypothetical protein
MSLKTQQKQKKKGEERPVQYCYDNTSDFLEGLTFVWLTLASL